MIKVSVGDWEELPAWVKFKREYFVLTDIHGKYRLMRALLKRRPKGVRPIILGDLTDRGFGNVEETIKLRKETDTDNKYIDDLLAEAAKTVEVDVPETLIHEEAHRMVHQYEEHLQMQGLTLEQFFKFTNSSEEALMDQMHDEAKNRVLYRLMLEEIAKVENLEVSEKEAEEQAATLAEKYQMTKEEFLESFGGIEMIKYDLTMRAAIDILKGEK
jgi:trigger factor